MIYYLWIKSVWNNRNTKILLSKLHCLRVGRDLCVCLCVLHCTSPNTLFNAVRHYLPIIRVHVWYVRRTHHKSKTVSKFSGLLSVHHTRKCRKSIRKFWNFAIKIAYQWLMFNFIDIIVTSIICATATAIATLHVFKSNSKHIIHSETYYGPYRTLGCQSKWKMPGFSVDLSQKWKKEKFDSVWLSEFISASRVAGKLL